MRQQENKQQQQQGSGYVGHGTYGCVSRPPVRCTTNTNKQAPYYKSAVGKYFKHDADANVEYELLSVMQKLDPRGTWTSRMLTKCKIDAGMAASNKCPIKSDEAGVLTQLIMRDGGDDLNAFIDRYEQIDQNTARKAFIAFFLKLKPVIVGLAKLNKSGYAHLDLKPANILYDGRKVRVIDFGLMREHDTIYMEENYKLLGFTYAYYPPEFKLWVKKSPMPNLHLLPKMFRPMIEAQLKRTPPTKRRDYVKWVAKADVWGLGMTLFEIINLSGAAVETCPHMYSIVKFVEGLINANPEERFDWETVFVEYMRVKTLISAK